MDVLLWLVPLALVLSGPVALIYSVQNSNKLKALEAELSRMYSLFATLKQSLKNEQGTPQTEHTSPISPEKAPATSQMDTPQTARPAPMEATAPFAEDKAEQPSLAAETADSNSDKNAYAALSATLAAERTKTTTGGEKLSDFEENLSSKWMIWLGGIALALGGGFIVKYSIEAGLLSPTMRVSLGIVVGILLTIGGELLRIKHDKISWLENAPDYVPQALAGAGLFTLFAAVLSAYSLYDLIGPLFAFIALAGVCMLASWFALAQGKLFAYLGLVGGLVVPALVSTGSGNAWALFPYLLLVVIVALATARSKAWADVAASALGLSLLWVPLWMILSWHAGDGLPVGLYTIILAALTPMFLSGATPGRSTHTTLASLKPLHPVSLMSDAVTVSTALLLVTIVRLEHYGGASLWLFGLYIVGSAYMAIRDAEFDIGAIVSLLAGLFILTVWHVPDLVEIQNLIGANPANQLALAPIAPPGFRTFVTASVLLAGGTGFAVYFLMPFLLRKPMWTAIGAAYPLLVIIIAYGRLNDFETSIPFSFIALLIAALSTAAVAGLKRQVDFDASTPIAAYAAAATAGLSLAFAMALRDAWLTTAFAAEIVAMAYIWRITSVQALRTLALILASIVLIRLFANVSILDYGKGEPLAAINWLFYGYALTALLFAGSAKVFGRQDEGDRLYSVLIAGSVLLLVGFVTLEIRVLAGKTSALDGDTTALEMALQTVNWTAATTLLFWRELRDQDSIFRALRRFMTGIIIM